MKKILNQNFFERSAPAVARGLLGKYLCRKPLGGRAAKCYMITDVEAYAGPRDKASHAHRGKTARNAPMFGEAGRWYVYFTYGMHWMLNIVTGPKNYPAAVLIRGAKGVRGPARLTKFLRIDKRLNNKLANPRTGLWIESASRRRGNKITKFKIKRAPRIGVDYAREWAKKPYRFLLIGI